MGQAADLLVSKVRDPEPYGMNPEELAALQLEAANERLAERREAIPALRRRCEEIGLERVDSLADLVPVLFSHTTYKSYPEVLVENGKWSVLNRWVSSLSALPGAETVDVAGATDVDGWLTAMHAAGHHLNATSGTTGKCSFLDQSETDFARPSLLPSIVYKTGIAPSADRPFFGLVARHGFHQFTRSFNLVAEAYGRPGDIHFLTDEPSRVADINHMGRLRRSIAQGTATPGEIAQVEEQARRRAGDTAEQFRAMARAILDRRDEPIVLMGLAAQHWALVNAMRELGVERGALHPDSIVGPSIRRNTKGNVFPDDYAEQIFEVYGIDGSKVLAGYGMSEISSRAMLCEAGRYHFPPWQPILLVDRDATRALPRPKDGGIVEGRAAFFDIMIEARWGAVLSGDKVQVDHGAFCPCGRPGPSVLDTIERYADVNDDKLSCAGSVNSYIRGVLAND